jgi:hypothetical protein
MKDVQALASRRKATSDQGPAPAPAIARLTRGAEE